MRSLPQSQRAFALVKRADPGPDGDLKMRTKIHPKSA